jgi:hypothetical protein
VIETMSAVARDVVSAQPDPPRAVQWRQLLWAAYGTSSARWVVGIGGVLGAAAFASGVIATGEPGWRLVILVISGSGFLLFVGAPAIMAMRTGRALSRGIRVPATVVEVQWTGPGDGSTIDALRHGMARGRRRVEHPHQPFTQPFETDASWARELQPGSSMLVLVDPSASKVLFDLGPMRSREADAKTHIVIETEGDGPT